MLLPCRAAAYPPAIPGTEAEETIAGWCMAHSADTERTYTSTCDIYRLDCFLQWFRLGCFHPSHDHDQAEKDF